MGIQVGGLREFGIVIGRLFLGTVVLMEGLVVLGNIVYLSAAGITYSGKVAVAYEDGYDQGYAQTYEVAYQEAYGEAYDRGYNKGYEIGRGVVIGEEVTNRVELHNPTYKELREFLARDKTDSNPFSRGEYVCFDFTADLNNNAEANGIRAAYVRIRFKEWGHAVAAFETVDRGLVFIEPQSDKEVEELVIGKPYPWQATGANRQSNYDDPIVEIQVIW